MTAQRYLFLVDVFFFFENERIGQRDINEFMVTMEAKWNFESGFVPTIFDIFIFLHLWSEEHSSALESSPCACQCDFDQSLQFQSYFHEFTSPRLKDLE